MAFIIGDGDNIDFIKGARKTWMDDRLTKCAGNGEPTCPPVLWTISPQLLTKAPKMIEWYFDAAQKTGADFFVLPPSGDLYSYPGEMPAEYQANYVNNTEHDCLLMSTSGSVTWEWFYKWNAAIDDYLPRYSANKIVKAFYQVNVPFPIPTFPCITDWCLPSKNKFTMIGEDVVLFHQREWRGTSGNTLTSKSESTPQQMADEINNYKNGTVSAVYTTSDGGFTADDLYEMITYLDDHVEIVNFETLTEMAIQAHHSGLG